MYDLQLPTYVEYTTAVVMNSSFAVGLYGIEGKEGRESSVSMKLAFKAFEDIFTQNNSLIESS